jgi:uncharacterized protein YecA (UPF0149 family)
MHKDTGEMFEVNDEDHLKQLQVRYNNRLLPLTEKQAKVLKPMSRRKRKWLMKHGSCPCGSGTSFKKCCL